MQTASGVALSRVVCQTAACQRLRSVELVMVSNIRIAGASRAGIHLCFITAVHLSTLVSHKCHLYTPKTLLSTCTTLYNTCTVEHAVSFFVFWHLLKTHLFEARNDSLFVCTMHKFSYFLTYLHVDQQYVHNTCCITGDHL